MSSIPLSIDDWLHANRQPDLGPRVMLSALLSRLEASDPAWITICDVSQLNAQLHRLEMEGAENLPLFGVPFAVKDNIDVHDFVTTAACPAFAYKSNTSATVVQRLQQAGAIVIGKTNLDQFATGLVGARSPYGQVPNTFNPAYVCGGSSSGSASVVARGLVPFALGTDTAGSGRVPAGLNNIVGIKPTPGTVPMQGVVPACKTLDVVSVFALSVKDAGDVLGLLQGADDEAVFKPVVMKPAWLGDCSRPLRVGVPAEPNCDESIGFESEFRDALARLHSMQVEIVPIDMGPLYEVAQLLYEGPWVAERYSVVKSLVDKQSHTMDPTVLKVISQARQFDACDTFEARYRLANLAKQADLVWKSVDVLMVPTTPTCPTFEALAEQPVALNSGLGRYTNFVNLLGWSALALPSSISRSGVPFGVTFIAPEGADAALVDWGLRWEESTALTAGARLPSRLRNTLASPPSLAAEPTLKLAVVGAHLKGLPLHQQLVERHCRFVCTTRTATCYQLFALAGTKPPKPGMLRVDQGGAAIEVEVYEMPLSAVGSFLHGIPYPLGLGNVELSDGTWVKGFICDPAGLDGALDITNHGGWRAYLVEEALERANS